MFSKIMFMIYVMSSMLESYMLDLILVTINLVRNLNLQLSNFPTAASDIFGCNLEASQGRWSSRDAGAAR